MKSCVGRLKIIIQTTDKSTGTLESVNNTEGCVRKYYFRHCAYVGACVRLYVCKYVCKHEQRPECYNNTSFNTRSHITATGTQLQNLAEL